MRNLPPASMPKSFTVKLAGFVGGAPITFENETPSYDDVYLEYSTCNTNQPKAPLTLTEGAAATAVSPPPWTKPPPTDAKMSLPLRSGKLSAAGGATFFSTSQPQTAVDRA